MADPQTRFGIPIDPSPYGFGTTDPNTDQLDASSLGNAAPILPVPGSVDALPPATLARFGVAPPATGWVGPSASTGAEGGGAERPPGSLEEATKQALDQAAIDPTKLSPAQLALLDQGRGRSAQKGSSSSTVGTTKFADPEAVRAEHAKQDVLTSGIQDRAGQLAQVQTAAAADVAGQQDRLATDLMTQTAARDKVVQQQQADFDKFASQQAKDTADYIKQANSLDPKRLVRGKEWMVGLAAGLGAYGGALAGGPNTAAQMIEAALDRDLSAQKEALSAKRESLSLAQQQFGQKQTQFQNRVAAAAATKADMMDVASAQLRSAGARREGAEAAAQTATAADQIALRASELRAAALEQEKVTRSTTTQSAQTALTGTALDAFVKQAEGKTKIDKAYSAGEGVSTQDRQQFKDTMAGLSAAGDAVKDVTKYKAAIGNNIGAGVPLTVSREGHTQDVVGVRLTRKIAMAQNKGQLSENDVRAAEQQMTSGAWSPGTLKQKADEALAGAVNKVASDIATLPAALQPEAERRARALIPGWDYLKRGEQPPTGSALITGAGGNVRGGGQ